ncbi:MAG: hypothetical protein ACF8QF_08570, partial [Phycisphaerales bacterium]
LFRSRIIFGADYINEDAGLKQVSSLGGAVTMYLPRDASAMIDFHDVAAIHGANAVVILRHTDDVSYSIEVYDGRRSVVAVEETGPYLDCPAWSPSGHILYTRTDSERAVWAQPFDLASMQATGDPVLVENQAWSPSVSANGDMLLRRGADSGGTTIAWADAAGETRPNDTGFDVVFGPIASPDGRRVAFAATNGGERFDIWVHDTERGLNQRITFVERMIAPMFWSPDGREIVATVFDPVSDPPLETKFFHTDGSGESRPGLPGMLVSLDEASQTGAVITGLGASAINAVRIDDPDDAGTVVVERASGSNPKAAALSPDGSLLAYVSTESGQPQVYCTTFPSGAGKWQVSTQGGVAVEWAADGDHLYFQSGGDAPAIYEVAIDREPGLRFSQAALILDGRAAEVDFDGGWNPPDEHGRILTTVAKDDNLAPTSLSLIQHWAAMLEQR